MDKVEQLAAKFDTLPASPALLPRLARLLEDINTTDIYEIVDVVMYDSALTAKLLQIANSAYFGNHVKISNVGEAINLLGYDVVFMLAAAISGQGCIRATPGTGLDSVLLWKHSVTTAFGAQYVARAAGLDGNLAFTAGLLHDLGKVVFAETYGKNYASMFDPTKRGDISLVEWESEHYGCNHADVGATLLENWKLPESVVGGVKFHHHPSDAGENAPLAASVCLGNALSHFLEKPVFGLDPDKPEIEMALVIVNLTTDDLKAQWDAIRGKWKFVQMLCDLWH
jgi:putative nucleotidyltransferase with HDIG domain